jgi:hypothetical protein
MKVCIENGLKFEPTRQFSSPMSTVKQFIAKKLLMLERNTPFNDHSWLPMTSGFPALKCTLKG